MMDGENSLVQGTHAARQNEPPAGHEASDVDVRRILGFGLGLLVTAVAVHVLVWLLFLYFSGREAARLAPASPLSAGQDARVPPEPRLQTNPREDLRELRAREDELLTNYAWVDKTAGIVRIPIEEAMKIIANRGLPTRQAGGDSRK
jgi:hypothetical protein